MTQDSAQVLSLDAFRRDRDDTEWLEVWAFQLFLYCAHRRSQGEPDAEVEKFLRGKDFLRDCNDWIELPAALANRACELSHLSLALEMGLAEQQAQEGE